MLFGLAACGRLSDHGEAALGITFRVVRFAVSASAASGNRTFSLSGFSSVRAWLLLAVVLFCFVFTEFRETLRNQKVNMLSFYACIPQEPCGHLEVLEVCFFLDDSWGLFKGGWWKVLGAGAAIVSASGTFGVV